jgi:hypothetical protein
MPREAGKEATRQSSRWYTAKPATAGKYVKTMLPSARITVSSGRVWDMAEAVGRSRKDFFGHKFRLGRVLPRGTNFAGVFS